MHRSSESLKGTRIAVTQLSFQGVQTVHTCTAIQYMVIVRRACLCTLPVWGSFCPLFRCGLRMLSAQQDDRHAPHSEQPYCPSARQRGELPLFLMLHPSFVIQDPKAKRHADCFSKSFQQLLKDAISSNVSIDKSARKALESIVLDTIH